MYSREALRLMLSVRVRHTEEYAELMMDPSTRGINYTYKHNTRIHIVCVCVCVSVVACARVIFNGRHCARGGTQRAALSNTLRAAPHRRPLKHPRVRTQLYGWHKHLCRSIELVSNVRNI